MILKVKKVVRVLLIWIVGILISNNANSQISEMDFSGLDVFWKMVDQLKTDREADEKEWAAFLNHPGYAITERKGGRHDRIRAAMELSFRPSLSDSLKIVLKKGNNRIAKTCRHLLEASAKRKELQALQMELANDSELIRAASQSAMNYLPTAAEYPRTPVVYVILFEENGFGGEDIAVDQLMLMRLTDEHRTNYLGHELYHSYRDQLDPFEKYADLPEIKLIHALSWIQDEGIASLIDKVQWLEDLDGVSDTSYWKPIMSEFATLYSTSNQVINKLDSILISYSKGDITVDEAGSQVARNLPWSGHPTGTYMAILLENEKGRDYIVKIATEPLRFLIDYNEVAKASTGYSYFSPQAISVLEDLHLIYINSQ